MSKKVVFIGVDGLQLDEALLRGLSGEMPNFNRLNIVEAYTGGDKGTPTQQPTVSGPGWSTLLTGVWTDRHGVTDNNNAPITAEVDSLFEAIDAGIPGAKIASIVNWSPINTGHFSRESGLLGDPAVIDIRQEGINDAAVTQRVVDLIAEEAPDFTFLQLDEIDGAGHNFGFGPEYEKALIALDKQIGDILAAVAEREAANSDEEWMVIVSTDHGRTPGDGFGHGAQTDSERRIFIASNVDLGTFSEPVPQTSVATTILDFLDVDFSLGGDGFVSGSVLEGAGDPLPPVLTEILLPTDNAIGAPIGTNLQLRFSEAVEAGDGDILIRRASDGQVVETIAANSSRVTITGNTATIDLVGDLAYETAYFVEIEEGAFTDGTNAFAGIDDPATWSFTTENDPGTRVVLFSEDFEDLADDLQPFVSGTESGGDGTDFTATLPDGWSQTVGAPTGGPVEFFGWTFLDRDSWVRTAGDQLRSEFVKGSGVVMVADPDEYDDGATDLGSNLFNASIRTLSIDLTAAEPGSLQLSFDSSWRFEGTQSARVTVSYDGAAPVAVLNWSSNSASANFKADATNERVILNLAGVEGASTAVIAFELFDAGNNWWWAIDDIELTGRRTATGEPAIDGTPGDDKLFAGAGDDTVFGNGGNDILRGEDGNDRLLGGIGNDNLGGDAGADNLSGETGDDVLNGGAGDDVINGGDGIDYLFGDIGNDVLVGGEGDDTLDGAAGDDDIQGGNGNDKLQGKAGNDLLSGEAGDDLLQGGEGGDELVGGAGRDTLWGDAGDDSLAGGAEQDVLRGGEGTDTLFGDAGRDLLYGGAGNDVFAFGSASDTGLGASLRDRIFDWASGDGIDLSAIDANSAGGTANDAFVFVGGSAFSAAGQIRFVADTGGHTIVQANLDNDFVTVEFEIELNRTVVTLAETDFAL